MTAAVKKALALHQPPESKTWRMDQLNDKIKAETLAQIKYSQLIRGSLLSDEWPRCVLAFRSLMKLECPDCPRDLTPEEKLLHGGLLFEELSEFNSSTNMVEAADGLLDLIYVALGAMLHMGFGPLDIIAGFTEVHCSNMTKVMDDGRPLINDGLIDPTRPIGKVLKTHNYIPPDLPAALGIASDKDPVTFVPVED